MVKILLSGASGQMGRVIAEMAGKSENFEIVCGFGRTPATDPFPIYSDLSQVKEAPDVVIDFSDSKALEAVLDYGLRNQVPLVLASTGYSPDQEAKIQEAAKDLPILYSRNMSLGVNVMEAIAEKMAAMLEDFDIEIIEKHHRYKKDSPSGTAKMLFEAVNKGRESKLEELDGRSGFYDGRPSTEVGVSAIRGGNIVGEHTIIFAGEDEVMELTHIASSKKIFASGSLKAAKFMKDAGKGLYTMQDVL